MTAGAARSRSRKKKREAREIEENIEVEQAAKRRSSLIEGYLNTYVNVTAVLDISSVCMNVPEDGPEFLDNGCFSPAPGAWVVLLSARDHLVSQ